MYSKNAWNKYSGKKLENVMAFNDDYKNFLSTCKTERLCVDYAVALAKKNGYKNINEVISELSDYEIKEFNNIKETLEDYFMKFYKEDKEFGGNF